MSPLAKITVHAGDRDRVHCPVSVEIPLNYGELGGAVSFELKELRVGRSWPCQLTPTRGGTIVTFLIGRLRAGERRTLRLVRRKSESNDGVLLSDDAELRKLDVTISGKLFTRYHYGMEWFRPFLQPVVGPSGVRVTRNWPVDRGVHGETNDHPHHKSLWVAHGECDTVDNWSEKAGHGYQRHRRFVSILSGPVYGEFAARIDWCNAKDRKQFEETRRMRFYALPSGVRLFDLEISFKMTEKDVTFRDTKEGGLLSVRVASAMEVPRGGRIENGYGGINERETWGKKAPWCDYSGVVDGQHVGIAVMDHEANPRYPTEWHVRDYGLMTANCFGWSHFRPEAKTRGDLRFRKGSTTSWRYRVYVHRDDAGKGKVRDRFLDYIAPPEVTVG